MSLTLHVLPDQLAVCQLRPGAVPQPPEECGSIWSLALTADERSLVCAEKDIPSAVSQIEQGWRALRVAGPLDFSLTGILAGLSGTLAQAAIPIFAISTFNTDYILVKAGDLRAAATALGTAGYTVFEHPPGRSIDSEEQAEVDG